MSYRIRVYKTMSGYYKATGKKYVTAEEFFSGEVLCYKDNKPFYAQPSAELRAEVAKSFTAYHWRNKNHNRLVALSTGVGADFSYLQCFYVGTGGGYKNYFGTSLCGDAYDYCRRGFTKSAN